VDRVLGSIGGSIDRSIGERYVQKRAGTEQRADRFYAEQVLAQEMMFLATSDGHDTDSHGAGDSFDSDRPASSASSTNTGSPQQATPERHRPGD
jgi:hypothetical protein